jgi:hypothetical protein
MTQEVRPMYRHDHIPAAGRAAGAATRRRWSRRLLLAVAAGVLGLLPGIPSLAPAGPAVLQAAEPDQPLAAAPAGGLAGAVPSADHGPTHDMLDGAVVSSGAPDERLDVSAALDQGARLFSLEARYQAGDYDLAGPAGVSHQPLAEVFAPLAAWLAAPGHEHELVWLWVQTDPRSADPGRFDAACQAFTTALGPYLLKASDLPAGKAWGELAPDELAALRSRPRVATDWSACTGEQLPTAAPKAPVVAAPAAAATSYDHWMADMSDAIGPRLLKQVVIPGSHDAGTYSFGGVGDGYAQAQDEDIGQQLTAGSRYLDVRAVWHDTDFWNVHGAYVSCCVRLSQMLDAVADFANQPGHEKEIILLQVAVNMSPNMQVAQNICREFLARAGDRLLQPSMLPTQNVWNLSLDDLWSLPNHPTIITDWSGCTLQAWPDSGTGFALFGGYYANQCEADRYAITRYNPGQPGIINALTTALPGPYSAKDDPDCAAYPVGCPYPELPDKVVHGLYVLGLQATPTVQCLAPLSWFTAAPEVHTAVLNWYLNNQYNTQQNLNIIAGDFVESRGIVDLAIVLNRLMGAPGARVQASGDPAIYLIDSDGTRRLLPDPQTVVNLFGPTPAIIRRPVSDITAGPELRSGAYLAGDGGKIYLVEPPNTANDQDQGRKRWITSPDVFNQFGFDAGRVRTETLAALPDGPDLTGTWQVRPGLLLQPPGDPKIYLVDVDGSLRHIADQSTLTSLYGDNGAPIEPHDLSGLTIGPDLPSGTYLATDGVKTYLVEPTANDQGRKRWITSPPVFDQFAFNPSKVQTVDPLVLAAMPCGPDLTGRLGTPTTTCNAPLLNITMDDQPGKMVLHCQRDPRLTSPATLSLAAQAPNPPQPLSVTGSDTLSLTVPTDYFPPGNYWLTATCTTSGPPRFAATPLTLSSGQVPMTLRATPSSGLQLAITCINPQANGIHAVAYPAAAGPNSPDAQPFDARAGQPTLQATYSRRANYDVRVDCSLGGGPIHTVTVLANAFAPLLTIRLGNTSNVFLLCYRDPQLTSPATLSLAAQTPNAPQPLSFSGSGSYSPIILPVPPDYFPNGNYQLTATCASSDTPPWTATPLTLSSSQIPMTLRATPTSGLQLAITCANPEAEGIHAVAYPASAGPNSPDAQPFDARAGQPTLQATYSRRANYDVRVDCSLGGGPIHTLTVPASAFPPLLTISTGRMAASLFLYCGRNQQLTSPATLSLAAQTPNAPTPLSVTGSDKTISLTVPQDYFPAGDYQLTATCASSDTPPFAATPLTLSSSQIPTRKVTAEITGCSAQGGNAYACALQVTLGGPLAVNKVFSVGIGGGGFANPSGGGSPQVTASPGCQHPPNPSPYLADGNGSYTRYDVNISPGGCTAGAVVSFGEAVTGAAAAPITQQVTVPGLGASTATFVLP